MKASTFTKLSSDIVRSSVWLTAPHVRLVWVTMLALADRDGWVGGSVGGLAHAANLPVDQVREALAILSSPDPDSRNPDNDGRRIAVAERGWTVLNHSAFRNSDSRREYMRGYMREYRKRGAASDSDSDSDPDQTETDTEVNANTLHTPSPAAPVLSLPGLPPEPPAPKAKPLKLARGVTEPQALALAAALIAELNRLTGSSFRPDGRAALTAASEIVALGYTPAQAATVAAFKCADWKADEKMRKHLNPTTLLRPSNFPGYLEAAEASPRRGGAVGATPVDRAAEEAETRAWLIREDAERAAKSAERRAAAAAAARDQGAT